MDNTNAKEDFFGRFDVTSTDILNVRESITTKNIDLSIL